MGSNAPPWSVAPDQVAVAFVVDPAAGLSADEAERRLREHGLNQLKATRPPGVWSILLGQFANSIALLLAVAAVVALVFGEWLDGTAILCVLAINSAIGFFTEYRAIRSMEALRSLGSVQAKVRRDARELEIPATRLVPGDIVLIEAGDVVTADVRVLEASKLEADESALTGESVPVAKSADPVHAETSLPERACMLFKGTAVTKGTAETLVVAAGMTTELGRIARLVQEAEQETTPLEKRLTALARKLIWATVLIAISTTVLGIAGGKPFLIMVETGIALAVAAIPEGLPIVATMALARGMWRMARRNALINRLSAVETLGATSVIFTDKTGTLTENRMTVRSIALAGGLVEVDGARAPAFRQCGRPLDPTAHAGLRTAIEAAVLCNNATLDTNDAHDGLGDPMELALLNLGAAAGIERDSLLEAFPEVREEAFDTTNMMMATIHRAPSGYRIAVKGAPESVVGASTSVLNGNGEAHELTAADREQWKRVQTEMASDGLRVLAIARGEGAKSDRAPYEQLTLLALLGLSDPPRAGVREALAACRGAGIRVVMVTGDHAETAMSIARGIALIPEEDSRPAVRGRDLEQLDSLPEKEQRAMLMAPVFARVTPEQKLALIAAYQRMGHVVAMTGDGVNDAPALRKADIGVAMGKRGTQVAREAADMVLTDDAFGSIVAAVEQGRVIFDNIRKFVFYLLSCNVGEVLAVSLAALIGAPLPLLPLQILYLNLITDVFPALALSFGEGDPSILRRPPRASREPIVTRRGWLSIGAFGLIIATSVLIALHLAEHQLGYSQERAVTVSFLTLAIAQLWHVFNAREPGGGLLKNEVTRNRWVWGALGLCALLVLAPVFMPGLRTVLQTTAPDARGWGLVIGMSLVPLILGQAWAVWRTHTQSRRDPSRGNATNSDTSRVDGR